MRRADLGMTVVEDFLKHAGKSSNGGGGGSSSSAALTADEKKRLTEQLSTCKSLASWQKTPDHYRLLGLARTCRCVYMPPCETWPPLPGDACPHPLVMI